MVALRGRGRSSLAEDLSKSALERLSAAGLLYGGGEEFSYRPTTPELATAVVALAEIHGDDGLDVIKLLNSKAFDRIRSAVSALGDVLAPAKDHAEDDDRETG